MAQVTNAVTVTTTSETAAVTSPAQGISPPTASLGLVVRGNVNFTAGTGATAVTIRVRQGSGITGTLVGNALTVTVAAGSSYDLAFDVVDTSPVPAQQYTVTVTQTAATGNGTVNQADIETDLVIP